MTINNKFLILPALLLLAGSAAAQQQLTLDWDAARRLAAERNPAVKAARASMEQAGFSYKAALNSYMPQVGLSHSVGWGGGPNGAQDTRWSAGVSASEDLLNLKTVSSVKTSRISKEKAEADYLSASASARQGLAGAFADLLFAQRRVEVQKKILNIRVENAKLIRLKYESGMESKGNALYTEALAENAGVSVKKAERQQVVAQRALLDAIGLEGAASVTAKGDIGVPSFELDEARVARALEKAPRIVSAKKTLEAAKERTESSRYYAYPTLRASQGLNWSGDSEFPQYTGWSLGLSLNIPLFSGGPTYYFNSLAAAKKAQAAAEENFRAEKISLGSALRSGYDDYLSAAETALASGSLLKANDERYKEAQIKYMAGKISFIDLENVEQNFVDSDLNQLDYARSAHSRKLALEQLLGVGIEE
ncbi:MAG TPA: TolC family protein [Elusimicrobiales bacterium]|nr:TolC family protein [Elusimicrobiales bacterium]